MLTPWGKSQTSEKMAEGVYEVTTAGHGGILVGKQVAREKLSEQAQAIGREFGSWLAFEEDCAWAAVAYEHPEWFVGLFTPSMTEERIKMQAGDTLARWYPEYRG